MLHGGTTIPGTVLALFVPILITCKAPSFRYFTFAYTRKSAIRVPNRSWKYDFDHIFQDFPDSEYAVYKHMSGQYQFITVTWAVGVVIEKNNIWLRMLHQRAIWGWSVRLAEQSHLTARASLFVMFYSSVDLFDASCKIKILVCAKSPK